MLFDNIERIYLGRRLQHETHFQYLNRSARSDITLIREAIERWLENYPETHRKQIVSELRSKNENKFRGAFLELYIYQMLYKLGAEIEIHPVLPHTDRRPDFLIKFKDGEEFYLELTTIGKTEINLSGDKIIAKLVDEINADKDFNNCPYRLFMCLNGRPKNSQQASKVKKQLKIWLKSLQIVEKRGETMKEDKNKIRFNIEDFSIDFTAIPKANIDENDRIISAQSIDVNYHSADHIRESICKKYHYYGELDKPLVLCVSVTSFWHVEKFIMQNVLFGTTSIRYFQDNNRCEEIMDSNGLWTRNGDSHERLSALIVVGELDPSSMFEHELEIFFNPYAKAPISDSPLFKLSHWIPSGNELKFIEGISVRKLLNLSDIKLK